MKKILFLMAILPMMLLTACSSDDDKTNDYESALVGSWIEDTDYTREVLNIELKSDKTGFQWGTNDGETDEFGKEAFTWKATESKITITLKKGGSMTMSYAIKGSKLHISSGDETIIYIRK